MEDMVDQPQAWIGSPAKIRIMIVAQPSAQGQLAKYGELILTVQGPDYRAARLGTKHAANRNVFSLVLPQVVGDLGAQRNFVFLEHGSAQLHLAVPPVSPERVVIHRGWAGGKPGGIGQRRLQ